MRRRHPPDDPQRDPRVLGWRAFRPFRRSAGPPVRPSVGPEALSEVLRKGTTVSDRSNRKGNSKKAGKSLKEKRAVKKAKKSVKPPVIPPTGR